MPKNAKKSLQKCNDQFNTMYMRSQNRILLSSCNQTTSVIVREYCTVELLCVPTCRHFISEARRGSALVPMCATQCRGKRSSARTSQGRATRDQIRCLRRIPSCLQMNCQHHWRNQVLVLHQQNQNFENFTDKELVMQLFKVRYFERLTTVWRSTYS